MCDNNSLKSRKNSSCFLRAITAFLMLAVFFPLMPAQEKPIMRFSLSEAREYAVRHSFETAKSQIDLDAAGQKLKETLAIGLPQVSSTLSYNNNLKLATSLIPNIFEGKFDELIPVQFGTQHTANWGVTVQQLIFQGSYIVGLQTSGIYKKLAGLALKNEKVKYLPTVSAFFTYEQSAYRNKFNFFNSDKQWFTHEILGVTISMPIFQSGGQKARVKQAALALDKARRSREQAAEALQMETDQVKSRLLTAQETLINMTANMKLASKVYLVTQEKFREGVSSSMELTQAHDQYLAAQSEYIKAVSELLSARNRLNRISNQYSH